MHYGSLVIKARADNAVLERARESGRESGSARIIAAEGHPVCTEYICDGRMKAI